MAKSKRVGFRVDETIKTRVRDAAAKEDMTPTEFSRRLFQWAFDHYLRVGDWFALRKMQVFRQRKTPDRQLSPSRYGSAKSQRPPKRPLP
jgi:hypothetical protein